MRFSKLGVKFFFGLRKYNHVSNYYKKDKILRIEEGRKLHTLTQVHKLKKGIGQKYLLNKLKSRTGVHNHNTRRSNDIEIAHAKKRY